MTKKRHLEVDEVAEWEISERVDPLYQACNYLNEAYELIKNVVGDDGYVKAYLLDGLSHMANDDGNPYNLSVPQIIAKIREGKEYR